TGHQQRIDDRVDDVLTPALAEVRDDLHERSPLVLRLRHRPLLGTFDVSGLSAGREGDERSDARGVLPAEGVRPRRDPGRAGPGQDETAGGAGPGPDEALSPLRTEAPIHAVVRPSAPLSAVPALLRPRRRVLAG